MWVVGFDLNSEKPKNLCSLMRVIDGGILPCFSSLTSLLLLSFSLLSKMFAGAQVVPLPPRDALVASAPVPRRCKLVVQT